MANSPLPQRRRHHHHHQLRPTSSPSTLFGPSASSKERSSMPAVRSFIWVRITTLLAPTALMSRMSYLCHVQIIHHYFPLRTHQDQTRILTDSAHLKCRHRRMRRPNQHDPHRRRLFPLRLGPRRTTNLRRPGLQRRVRQSPDSRPSWFHPSQQRSAASARIQQIERQRCGHGLHLVRLRRYRRCDA